MLITMLIIHFYWKASTTSKRKNRNLWWPSWFNWLKYI